MISEILNLQQTELLNFVPDQLGYLGYVHRY